MQNITQRAIASAAQRAFDYSRFATLPVRHVNRADGALARLSAAMSSTTAPHCHPRALPHQRVAVEYISRAKKVLVADVPGMGKTASALLALDHIGAKRALIVAPAVTIANWNAETVMWSPGRTAIDTRIVSWEYMTRNVDSLRRFRADAIVFDEAHYAVYDSQRAAAARAVQSGQDYIVAMTGTPHVTSVLNIKSLADLIGVGDDDMFGPYAFSRFMLNGHDNPDKMPELEMLLRERFMLRRTKEQLGLAPPIIHMVELDVDSEYACAEDDLIGYLEDEGNPSGAFNVSEYDITRPTHLDRIAADTMLDSASAWLRTRRALNNEKWVVFASHRHLASELAERTGNYTLLGSDSHMSRRRSALAFQNDPANPVIVGSLKASGIGINLHTARNVALFGCHWTWATLQQGIDRVHRIGQTGQVNAYIFTGKGTVQVDMISRATNRMQAGYLDYACKTNAKNHVALITEE